MSNGITETKDKYLKGYIMLHRKQILFLKGKKISLTNFGAYCTLLLFADWDIRHSTFACLPPIDEVAEATGNNKTTWYRRLQNLVEHDLIEERVDGRYRIKFFWVNLPSYSEKYAKAEIASMEIAIASLQKGDAKLQQQFASLQIPVKPKVDNRVVESAVISEQSPNSVIGILNELFPKETLNNYKEVNKQHAASQQHSHPLVSPYKDNYEQEKEVVLCQICGRRMPPSNIKYAREHYDLMACYYCRNKM